MAADYLLEIEGIKGESADSKHPNTIEVESFSWGATQTGAAGAGGGGGSGKVVLQDFHFVTRISKASPVLFLHCATGEHIKKATLFVRKAGGDPRQDYYKVTLQDCLVSSYQQATPSEPEDVIPIDQFSLNFASLELDYKPQKDDGSLGDSAVGGWDLKQNKKI